MAKQEAKADGNNACNEDDDDDDDDDDDIYHRMWYNRLSQQQLCFLFYVQSVTMNKNVFITSARCPVPHQNLHRSSANHPGRWMCR